MVRAAGSGFGERTKKVDVVEAELGEARLDRAGEIVGLEVLVRDLAVTKSSGLAGGGAIPSPTPRCSCICALYRYGDSRL